jgi:hypothetical protein
VSGVGYLYDIARHVQPIAGLNATLCGEGDGSTVGELPRNLPDTPAAVVLDGDEGVIPGNNERWQLAPEVHIYVAQDQGLGAAYELARSFKPLLLARFQASITTTELVSLVIREFRQIEDRAWPVDSERHYFVLPCVLEGRVDKQVTYNPPTRV